MKRCYVLCAIGVSLLPSACVQSNEGDETATSVQSVDHFPAEQCAPQVNRIADEFDRALSSHRAEVAYFTTTSKFNPCTCGTTLEPASVTTVTGSDWHASPQWSFKAAERFEFANGDVVIVDTTTGFHNALCADGRVEWTNWLQWITGDAISSEMCSTLGCGAEYPNWEDWCGPLLVCAFDSYCTFPESGATCPE